MDLIEIDAASQRGIDDVKELTQNSYFTPTQGKYKVYLIDRSSPDHWTGIQCSLKALEEPPEHMKFLLATTEPEKLPITVLSRCLRSI